MRERHIILVCGLCCLLVPNGIVFAQNFKSVGVFSLQADVEGRQYYNNNIYASPDDQKSDVFTEIEPRFKLKSNWTRHQLDVEGSVKQRQYFKYTTENTTTYDVGIKAGVDITKVYQINLQGKVSQYTEDRTSPEYINNVKTPVTYQKKEAQIAIQQNAGRFDTQLGMGYAKVTYDDGENMAHQPLSFSDKEYHSQRSFLSTTYHFDEDANISVSVALKNQNYEQPDHIISVTKDYNEERATLKFTHKKLTGKLSGNAEIQAVKRDFNSDTIKDVSDLLWSGKVAWQVNGLTSIVASRIQSLEDLTRHQASSYISTEHKLSLNHQLRRYWRVSAALSRQHYDYQNVREEDGINALTLDTSYNLNPHLALMAGYSILDRENNVNALKSFNQHQIMVGVKGQL